MSPTATARELDERLEQRAAVSAARAAPAAADAQRVRMNSIEIQARRRARPTGAEIALDPDGDHRTVSAFRVEGVVDGVAAYARWSAHGLECSPALWQRIEIVVAMGETFDPGGGRPLEQASLDGPLKAVLPTVIRAFSSVTSIELAVGQVAPQSDAS